MASQYAPHHSVYSESGKESELEILPINADIAERSSEKAVARLHTRGYTKFSDLLEKLPPELSLRCIHETLPSDAGYASQLLQLATVSRRWQAFIISAPTLWSEIHISPSEQDSLATLAVFIHQSGTTPLDLTIGSDVELEWDAFRFILLPHNQRIHRLRFNGSITPALDISSILASLDFLPNLQELRFISTWTDLSQFQLPPLPLMARITGNIVVNPEFLASHADILPRLSEITVYAALDEIHSALPSLTNLSSLQFSFNSSFTSPDQSIVDFNTGMLPRLRHIRHPHMTYSGSLERLLRFTSTQLTQLSLRIPENKIGKLIETLLLLSCLQTLTLHIDVDGKKTSANVGSSSVASHSLRSLAISSDAIRNTYLPNDSGQLLELFSALKGLYQSVDSASFSGFSVFQDPACSFLEGLVAIDSLLLHNSLGDEPIQRSLSLPSVTSLNLSDTTALALLNVPNLLLLRIPNFLFATELAGFTFPKLRRLLIEVDGAADFTSTLGFNYPELQSIDIFTYNWQGAWNLLLLQQLVSITLSGDDSPGNRLCVSLLYQPECCPSLQQLHFSDFIEWDILFLLLERRNLGLQGVKKIERVTLPYVPFAFREPLDDLFNGKIGDRPPDLPLLLEETRELVCDPSIQGCTACLKNMWPHCSSTVFPRLPPHGYRDEAIVFPVHDDPPDVVPSRIKDWFFWRVSLQKRWKESFAKFLLHTWRQLRCIRVDHVINRSHVFVQ